MDDIYDPDFDTLRPTEPNFFEIEVKLKFTVYAESKPSARNIVKHQMHFLNDTLGDHYVTSWEDPQ